MELRLPLSVLALAAMATACVSVLPEQAVPNGLYRLSDINANTGLDADLVVREPRAARLFAGQDMVVEGSDGALRLITGVEWAGRSTRLLKDGLIDAFATDGPGTAVSDMTGGRGAFELEWRVQHLMVSDGDAVCGLSLTLLDGENREPVSRTTLETRIPVSGDTSAARARALSDTASDCVEAAAVFVSAEIQQAHSAAETFLSGASGD